MNNQNSVAVPLVSANVDLHLADTGNASVFAQHHRQYVRYCFRTRKWYCWDGKKWAEDNSGEIQQRAIATAQSLLLFGTKLQDSDRRDKFVKHGLRSLSEQRIRAMVILAQSQPEIPIQISDFDTDQWLLNVLNGTIDLKTGELRPHRREDLITKLVPVAHDPAATCPRWEQFLSEIMPDDPDGIRHLQKAIGYSLTGSIQEHVFFILHGPGANGKSTFIIIIHRLLDSYAKKTPTETLLVKSSNGINNDVARLNGARFVSADEAENGKHLAVALVKQLSGGDKVAARFLYGEHFEFEPTFKIFLDVNHRPVIRGSDPAIGRRLRLIPFNVTIPPDKRDKNLVSKLEAELPGILRWAVEGCLLWQREGLDSPKSVTNATEAYMSEMDDVGDFINECCEVLPSAKTPFKDLFSRYQQWCSLSGDAPIRSQEFATALEERGFSAGGFVRKLRDR